MKKIPKFLICENPILNERHDGRSFILHTQEPLLLAEVFNFENLLDAEILEKMRLMPTGSRLDYGLETFFFIPVIISTFPKFQTLEKLPPQQEADRLAGVMRRMADWYEAYLIWEDNQ